MYEQWEACIAMEPMWMCESIINSEGPQVWQWIKVKVKQKQKQKSKFKKEKKKREC